jgi:hypothetical protein
MAEHGGENQFDFEDMCEGIGHGHHQPAGQAKGKYRGSGGGKAREHRAQNEHSELHQHLCHTGHGQNSVA